MLTADVRDGAAMQRAAAHAIDRSGSSEVVIANAGVSHGTATERAEDLAAFAEIMELWISTCSAWCESSSRSPMTARNPYPIPFMLTMELAEKNPLSY